MQQCAPLGRGGNSGARNSGAVRFALTLATVVVLCVCSAPQACASSLFLPLMRSPLLLLGLAAAAAVCAVSSVVAAPLAYTPAALADQIHNLPGLAQQPNFNMFSGYLVVDPKVNRSIFYCTTHTQRTPEQAALSSEAYVFFLFFCCFAFLLCFLLCLLRVCGVSEPA